MTPSELIHTSSSLGSESFVDEEDDKSEWNWRHGSNFSPNSGKGKKKTAGKENVGSGSCRFSCLSRKGFIIGLPKVPDTRFRSQDFAARIRCRLTGKGCKKPSFSFIPQEALADSRFSGHKGGGMNSFKTYEPGSPDVSCVGRIKLKTKEAKKLKTLTSAHREDRQPRNPQEDGKLGWFKKLCNFSRRKVESTVTFPDSRVAASDDLQNVGDNVEEERSRASVPRLSDLKRFASQREPSALSNFVFQDTDARERQQPVAESGDDQSDRVMESDLSGKDEINGKSCENSKPDEEEGLKKEMAGIGVASNCSVLNKVGVEESPRPPPCEINLWKRRSVAPPTALDLKPHHYGLDMRKPLTV